MAKFFPIVSSSEGNATYIGSSSTGVLVDAGASYKKLKNALEKVGITVDKVKAVVITHHHNDHIKGLRVFLKNNPVPVIASRETIYALEYQKIINGDTPRIYIDEIDSYSVGDILIKRYPTSHDCLGSSCYRLEIGEEIKTAVCTDLGIMTDCVFEALTGCDLVMLESNHDPVMLRLGPYPPELKLRIGSDEGHLPNAVCAQTISKLYETGTTRFVLAHLSETNNTPEKAASSVRAALMDKGAVENVDYMLYVAEKEDNRVILL